MIMKIDFPLSPQSLHLYSDAYSGIYAQKFQDSIAYSVMPNKTSAENSQEFKIYFIGDEEENIHARQICKSIQREAGYGDDKQIISNTIESIASSLVWNGWSVYEITYNEEKHRLKLVEFSTVSLYRLFGWYVQIAPEGAIKYRNIINILNANHIWSIEMPPSLGGKKAYKKIISDLNKYHTIGPDFYLDDMQNKGQSKSFNLKKYQTINQIFISKCTLKWGWDQNNMNDRYRTDFYMFYQLLTFHWAKTILRNHIIDELNFLFEKLDIESKIVIEGMPPPDEILLFREKLIKGEKTFDDVQKFIV